MNELNEMRADGSNECTVHSSPTPKNPFHSCRIIIIYLFVVVHEKKHSCIISITFEKNEFIILKSRRLQQPLSSWLLCMASFFRQSRGNKKLTCSIPCRLTSVDAVSSTVVVRPPLLDPLIAAS